MVGEDLSTLGVITGSGVVFSVLTGVGTWLFTRGGNEAVLKEQVKSAEKALAISTSRAEKAEASSAELLERLHAHMLADAAAFAKLESLSQEFSRSSIASESRLTAAIDKLVQRIDSMSERFDTLLQNQALIISQAPRRDRDRERDKTAA